MGRQSLLPRWVHRLYAHFFGYFWLPCPICGRPFGGHEKGETLYFNATTGQGTCRACRGEADQRNRKNGFIRGAVCWGRPPMARQSLLPRWLHGLYAHFAGYFWLPCPICGRCFGGHEKGGTLQRDLFTAWSVCRACVAEAKQKNRENGLFETLWGNTEPPA
jgi:hypothetical protein